VLVKEMRWRRSEGRVWRWCIVDRLAQEELGMRIVLVRFCREVSRGIGLRIGMSLSNGEDAVYM
jgi:hypothetical protein